MTATWLNEHTENFPQEFAKEFSKIASKIQQATTGFGNKI